MSNGIANKLRNAVEAFPVIEDNPVELFAEAFEEIDRQEKLIDNLAMLMRSVLSERNCNRRALQFLADNNLTGSPFRGEREG